MLTSTLGGGRRRRWSDRDKGRIVAESYAPEAIVSEVARRSEIAPQHLFAWRKAAREGRLGLPADAAPLFVPVVVAGIAAGGSRAKIWGAIDHDRDCRRRGAGRTRRRCRMACRSVARRAGDGMIAVPAGVRVLVATKPIDFRKGADGLAALIREVLGHDPFLCVG